MTRDEINPCDFGVPEEYRERAQHYANWCVHQEREACADICKSKKSRAASYFEINEYLQECADEIRARGQA